jgi:hypothetical protein
MIQLVNARDRLPVYHRTYWAKCDGARKMLHWHEFDHALAYYSEVLWIEEESDRFTPAKPKQQVQFETAIKTTEIIDHTTLPKPQIVPPLEPAPLPDFVVSVETIFAKPVLIKPVTTLPEVKFFEALVKPKRTHKKRTRKVPKEPVQLTAQEPVEQLAIELPKVVEQEPATPELPLMEREYGDHEFTKREDEDDYLWDLKCQEREALQYLMGFHKQVKHYWSSFNLVNVKHLFPDVTGITEIPLDLIPEMLWVYGKTGIKVINKKLLQSYRTRKSQQK